MSGGAADSTSCDAETSALRTSAPDVPDFDLIRPIGKGGFGEVWLAANRTTGRLRAVKLIPLKRSDEADPARREITSLTRLEASLRADHPHLMNIYHVGKTSQFLFYVMDPADDVSGGPASAAPGYRPATLRSRLEGGPLLPELCFRHARQLLAGLASLHEAAMVHRDVKPENCLFVEERLKLADFGLVTGADLPTSRIGTRKYMPPDGRMDTRADVYAAGLVIYEMIAGLPADRFPRLGDQAGEVVEDPMLNRLNRLVLRACQPDPQQRFQDAGQMLSELMTEPSAASPAARRRRRVIALIAGALMALFLVTAPWWSRRLPFGPGHGVEVNFITRPFNATVYLNGVLQTDPDGNPYLTPCTIPNLPAGVHRVTFRREGLPELPAGPFDFATDLEIVADWDLEP